MNHTIETATTGRAKCRGCGRNILKGELRFGERFPNPFAEGTEMTHWFHPRCAAMKRPEVFLETTVSGDTIIDADEVEDLRAIAEAGAAHRRLPRIDGAQRSPTGRATCRNCREVIEKDAWRIKLVFFEEGRFNPSGYIHVTCAAEYLEFADPVDRIAQFSPELSEADLAEIAAAMD